jgi:hypothetical protein
VALSRAMLAWHTRAFGSPVLACPPPGGQSHHPGTPACPPPGAPRPPSISSSIFILMLTNLLEELWRSKNF